MPEPEERERLRVTYAAMPDGQLLRLASAPEELTDDAEAALAAEVERRGLEPEVRAAGYDRVEELPLTLVARFRDLPEALLAKGWLASAGIESVLFNENMVRLDWFWSNLIGGISLEVRPEDAAAAQQILEQAPQDFTPDTGGEYRQPRCPRCQSLAVREEELDKPATYFLMWVGFPIPIRRERWTCEECGAAWMDEPEPEPGASPGNRREE